MAQTPIPAKPSTPSLKRKPRLAELVIQAVLFLCGLLSIFVTVGIIYELGKESMLFFGRTQWELTNKPIVADISSSDVQFEVGTSGASAQPGDVLRLGDELMLLDTVNGTTYGVERGYRDSVPSAHSAGTVLQRGVDPSIAEFLTGTSWAPHAGQFGVLPLLNATLMVSGTAILVALPLGLASAIYLSEYASQKARNTLKPILEVLAGVPTVVYGYFALTFMTPLLRTLFGQDTVQIYNTASAGIVIGILILPLVSTISEDALNAVPRSLREAAYGLGATKLETAVRVVLPAAFSGIAAAVIIAISRAIGETMVVALAAGAGPAFTFNPFEAAETMTGHIVRISGGDLSYDSLDYNSIFAIGLMLFVMTLALNIFSQYIVRRFREVYE
ncbi:MAG TPA: phosphate ABC transporter permease subunit PstC [Anaerolineales bacterium]|nr:phosphate ABC transporter permease subunit PstC [Anaerolineales bacterium]HRQ93009.1 phosphate ABC transporter permease subunit PstC [Anaerolineales bacterium]